MRASARSIGQRLLDRLAYNQLYAPDYPIEDRTSLEREERLIKGLLIELQERLTADQNQWSRLAGELVVDAFERLRTGDSAHGRTTFERAMEYVQNAINKKAIRADFVVGPDGAADHNP